MEPDGSADPRRVVGLHHNLAATDLDRHPPGRRLLDRGPILDRRERRGERAATQVAGEVDPVHVASRRMC